MNSTVNLPGIGTEKVPSLNEPHSLAIRIWHWSFFITLTASLVTVLFGSTLFKTSSNINFVVDQLQQKGIAVNKDQARAVAHGYSDKLWDLHTFIGYILGGLLFSRLLIEIAQPGEEKVKTKLKKALGFKAMSLAEKRERQHYIRVKQVYILFYILVVIMALTGLGLAFEDVPFLKDWHRGIGRIHGFIQYFIYGFIIMHLVGVIRADLGKQPGMVSGMIHQKKIG